MPRRKVSPPQKTYTLENKQLTPLGEIIATAIFKRRQSLRSFADDANIDRKTLSSLLEGGRVYISLRLLARVARLLALSLWKLLVTLYGNAYEMEAKATLLIDCFYRLSERNQGSVLDIMSVMVNRQEDGDPTQSAEKVAEFVEYLLKADSVVAMTSEKPYTGDTTQWKNFLVQDRKLD